MTGQIPSSTDPDRAAEPGPYAGRTRPSMADLVRELLLAGHLIDRAGMPHLISGFGHDVMREVAIGEWTAASPVYTERMQRLLGFGSDTVTTIFKGMQLDIGAPPQFMDFRYTVEDDHHGAFELAHCGALMDVEPMGDAYVETMCHHIEDPTFDATAAATNPRAQVRPLHRPPRRPADRTPHCAWTVTIDPDADPLDVPPGADRLARSTAARLDLPPGPEAAEGTGDDHYAGPLDPDLVLERFSSATLARIADEVALQGHLLSRAFLLEVVDQSSTAEAARIGARQLRGIGGLTAKRLAALLGVAADLDGVAAVLAVHPLGLPRRYVALSLHRPHPDVLDVSIGPCPALDEPDGLTWPAILVHDDRALSVAVQCVAPQASVERVAPRDGAVATWAVRIHPSAPPAAPDDDVTLTEFSTGASFSFTPVDIAVRAREQDVAGAGRGRSR